MDPDDQIFKDIDKAVKQAKTVRPEVSEILVKELMKDFISLETNPFQSYLFTHDVKIVNGLEQIEFPTHLVPYTVHILSIHAAFEATSGIKYRTLIFMECERLKLILRWNVQRGHVCNNAVKRRVCRTNDSDGIISVTYQEQWISFSRYQSYLFARKLIDMYLVSDCCLYCLYEVFKSILEYN
jgi:hypothetical protein